MTKPASVAILHAYSSRNLGDGLLVDATLRVVKEAFAPREVQFTILASDPESFAEYAAEIIGSKPTLKGWSIRYWKALSRLKQYDAVVAVGGGYLRSGHLAEFIKCAGVHLPQLLAAAIFGRAIYLPQSVGPFRFGTRPLFRYLLRRQSRVYLRDDRSMREVSYRNCSRVPDLALMQPRSGAAPAFRSASTILSVRAIRGHVPPNVMTLSSLLAPHDGYVQSTGGGNDDVQATALTRPAFVVSTRELLYEKSSARVMVAMRLHAAIMALEAGHYVIHLAYERKGFGAFDDLGMAQYVHNAFAFDPLDVAEQVRALQNDPEVRTQYDSARDVARTLLTERGHKLVEEIKDFVVHDV